MAFAAKVGLDVARSEPRSAGHREYLLVHRYDRDRSVEPDGRLHQEDFCQALGLVPGVKYENEGGPDVADCARLIHRHSGAPARDIIAFLDALLFNFLIGNNDAHSKNYSLLLDGPGAIRLAPLYDLLSTATIEGASRSLAMSMAARSAPGMCVAGTSVVSAVSSRSGRLWSSAAPLRWSNVSAPPLKTPAAPCHRLFRTARFSTGSRRSSRSAPHAFIRRFRNRLSGNRPAARV